jgi:signal transduction histidine kinase
MDVTSQSSMSTYELPLLPAESRTVQSAPQVRGDSLPEAILAKNAMWFCRLRWVIIGILVVFGVVAFFSGVVRRVGLRPQPDWPFVIAGILAVSNLLYLAQQRRLSKPGSRSSAELNLWCQIILDLLMLTVVVHYVGSLETFLPFTYLFHIVLACIFFSWRKSLVVTAVASVLYIGCVWSESAGIISPSSLWADLTLQKHFESAPWKAGTNVFSALAIWVVVWYLASHLSAAVRDRDRRLAETNRRLVLAHQEKARHMLRTTHELKAPFAAIHANVQLLLKGYCGDLSPQVREVAERISTRCRRLATEIQEMLQLANLSSTETVPAAAAVLDLAPVIRWCVSQLLPLAKERGVAVECDTQPARTIAVEDHIKMLFSNLLSNAVMYSHPNGKVLVRCRSEAGGECVATIEDHGIGIPASKLPRVFDEYYRTEEAVRHNKESSGLGLAIVRQIAEKQRVRVTVLSAFGAGTTFTLRFPPCPEPAGQIGREESDGVLAYNG